MKKILYYNQIRGCENMKKNKLFDLVAIVSILLLCVSFTAQRIPNDTFYTLKIGELILEKGIDLRDYFHG